MSNQSVTTSDQLRVKVWQGLTIVLGTIATLLAAWNLLFNNAPILGVVEVLLALFSLYIYRSFNLGRESRWSQYAYILLFVCIVAYAIVSRPFMNGIFVWPLFLPILAYLALGTRAGFIISLLSLLLLFSILSFKISEDSILGSSSVRLNFVFCYVLIWGISAVYEINRTRIEKNLEQLALTDVLTGVKNRLAFKRDFAARIESSDVFALILLDIDHFKKVNDEYGHETGDAVLRQLTSELKLMCGEANVYRHGGEEFCLLIDGEKEDVIVKAEKIRRDISQHIFGSNDLTLQVTISMGVAGLEDSQDGAVLLDIADHRMYQAKHQGRNRVVWLDSDSQQAVVNLPA
ncbi:hypothetical protein DN730_16505 [Marinomonas piezotolerans]|uniref:diguanylate cyclase n=1 Tax=Marinomonas piezotolerans TaxID=2213058 RepID=A0A370U5P2_9GAMM|nr:GGDEF domain-containing protein [Marinomonas piezotolerans]RDL43097.1 hypothetical protein DN730_16505 [Marinomonas piezotolerans]